MTRWLRRLKILIAAVVAVLATVAGAIASSIQQRRAERHEHGKGATGPPPAVPSHAVPEGAPAKPPSEIFVDGNPIHLPAPSIWPMVVALGTMLALFGLVTSLLFSLAGVVVLLVGLGGWIGEMQHE